MGEGEGPRGLPPAGTGETAGAEGAPPQETPPVCPGCSADLQPRSCKLRCPRCGYFEDCSNLI